MNQVTNRVQFIHLTPREKKKFDLNGYTYQRYDTGSHTWENFDSLGFASLDVYRLKIEDDKWYTVAAAGIKDGRPFTTLGSQLESYNLYRILRPAKLEEIPVAKEKTLEQKIQEKWPDKEVNLLKWRDVDGYNMLNIHLSDKTYLLHTHAQSMKGFHKYVYELLSGKLELNTRPIMPGVLPTLQPVAVLFEE